TRRHTSTIPRPERARAIVEVSPMSSQSPSGGDDWAASPYGPDDELGALNRLTPDHAARAASLVKSGRSYSLAVAVDADSPAYGVRKYECHVHMPFNYATNSIFANELTAVDEFVMLWPGVGTHIDGLGHIGVAGRFYNGRTVSDIVDVGGLKAFSTHTLPPIVTRGVFVDVAAAHGVDMLEGGYAIGPEEIEAALRRADLSLESGDVLLIRTGWIKLRERDPERYLASAPGISRASAEYLAECGVVLVGCDQGCTEADPAEVEGEFAPVHQINLAKHGVYQLQHITLEGLAADGVNEFMFVLGVPRLAGPSQMVVDPIAIA
ncbi:MAG: cyclase family protein, partial [Pseudomonadota bacterium]